MYANRFYYCDNFCTYVHHSYIFRFSSDSPDRMYLKETLDDVEIEVVLRTCSRVDSAEPSTVLPEAGLSVERQAYLSRQFCQYVRLNGQDELW